MSAFPVPAAPDRDRSSSELGRGRGADGGAGGSATRLDPQAVVAVIANAALVIGQDGRIIAANQSADAFFGSALVGRSVEDLVPADDRIRHAQYRRASQSHVRPLGHGREQRALLGNGTVVPVEITLSSILTDVGPATLSIVVDASERKAREAELLHLATTDPLTGLANRAALDADLARRFAVRAGTGQPLAVLAIDLDGFGGVNTRLGHAGGDALLCAFARRLRHSVREGDLVARSGGDEFVVVLEGGLQVARSIALRLAGVHTRHRRQPEVDQIEPSASIGIAIRRGRERPATLLRRADRALYAAKAAGRARLAVAP